MRRYLASIVSAALLLGCSGCAQNDTVNFELSYDVVGTVYTQYFAATADDLLSSINDTLSADGLSLAVKPNNSDRSVWFSDDGDTWDIVVRIFAESDIRSTSSQASGDPHDWIGYIKEVELSLYANDEESARANGLYVRALIHAFTPGIEKEVEDALGLYGTPARDAIVADGLYRVTVGNVRYTYQDKEKDGDRFYVEPFDTALQEELENPPKAPGVIRPD